LVWIIPDIICVRADWYHNLLGEIYLTVFHDMGPPGEEYSRSRRLSNNISQVFEKFWQVHGKIFFQDIDTDENSGQGRDSNIPYSYEIWNSWPSTAKLRFPFLKCQAQVIRDSPPKLPNYFSIAPMALGRVSCCLE